MSAIKDGNNKWQTETKYGGKQNNRWHGKLQLKDRWNEVRETIKEQRQDGRRQKRSAAE